MQSIVLRYNATLDVKDLKINEKCCRLGVSSVHMSLIYARIDSSIIGKHGVYSIGAFEWSSLYS